MSAATVAAPQLESRTQTNDSPASHVSNSSAASQDVPVHHVRDVKDVPAPLNVSSPRNGEQQVQALASPGPQSPTRKPLSYLESMLVLTQGATFLKFATKTGGLAGLLGGGQPASRYVFYEKGDQRGSMGTIYWCKVGRRTRDESRSIPLKTVTGLFEQAETAAFAGKVGAALSPDQRFRCFSIVAKDRTLDLQASSMEQRDIWMHAIHQILVHSGYGVHEAEGGSTTPGNFVGSPTSASAQAQAEANRLRLQIGSPMSGQQSSNQSQSGHGAHARYPSVGSMLSPPGGSAAHTAVLAAATPNAKNNTPANSPANAGYPVPTGGATHSGPPMPVLYEDPLLASKLLEVAALQAAQPLSPNAAAIPSEESASAASSPAAAAATVVAGGEARLTLPHGDEAALPIAGEVLSPSEHPTQTPACSPAAV